MFAAACSTFMVMNSLRISEDGRVLDDAGQDAALKALTMAEVTAALAQGEEEGRAVPTRHMLVVGNKKLWRNHSTGNKATTCALNNATSTDQTNQHGAEIGVTCCSTDGIWGSRPECKSSVGWEAAKQHCETAFAIC